MSIETIWLRRDNPSVPWGFRLIGGCDYTQPLTVQRVTPGSVASSGLQPGDWITKIGEIDTVTLTHNDSMDLIKTTPDILQLTIKKSGALVQKPESVAFQPPSYDSIMNNTHNGSHSPRGSYEYDSQHSSYSGSPVPYHGEDYQPYYEQQGGYQRPSFSGPQRSYSPLTSQVPKGFQPQATSQQHNQHHGGYQPMPSQGFQPMPPQGYQPMPQQGYTPTSPQGSQGYQTMPAQGYQPMPQQGYTPISPQGSQGYQTMPPQGYQPMSPQGYQPKQNNQNNQFQNQTPSPQPHYPTSQHQVRSPSPQQQSPTSPSHGQEVPDAVQKHMNKGGGAQPFCYIPTNFDIKEFKRRNRRHAPAVTLPKQAARQIEMAEENKDTDDSAKIVTHLQYNSPAGLYSEKNIEDTFKAQTQDITSPVKPIPTLSMGGKGGANIKNSEVLKAIQEEENRRRGILPPKKRHPCLEQEDKWNPAASHDAQQEDDTDNSSTGAIHPCLLQEEKWQQVVYDTQQEEDADYPSSGALHPCLLQEEKWKEAVNDAQQDDDADNSSTGAVHPCLVQEEKWKQAAAQEDKPRRKFTPSDPRKQSASFRMLESMTGDDMINKAGKKMSNASINDDDEMRFSGVLSSTHIPSGAFRRLQKKMGIKEDDETLTQNQPLPQQQQFTEQNAIHGQTKGYREEKETSAGGEQPRSIKVITLANPALASAPDEAYSDF